MLRLAMKNASPKTIHLVVCGSMCLVFGASNLKLYIRIMGYVRPGKTRFYDCTPPKVVIKYPRVGIIYMSYTIDLYCWTSAFNLYIFGCVARLLLLLYSNAAYNRLSPLMYIIPMHKSFLALTLGGLCSLGCFDVTYYYVLLYEYFENPNVYSKNVHLSLYILLKHQSINFPWCVCEKSFFYIVVQ